MLGQMTDMIIDKSRDYDLSLPPDLEMLRDGLDRRSTEPTEA
jgi:hypothetical protein